ncbi:hypothetical protein [Clostridium aminobutyricum]|uniref:Uncharacterized protein n=1 Tax=Clostridium aminobutyricum TaxID=33953 RepID=A0A939IHJ9_CLOAM|nr:hypothetical protein [Clostridium aminobutyricum]MBN7772061.1 hypothetical protein [Clostridium aminobutyricum]
MKQYVVLSSLIVLGLFIYNIIAGNDGDSILHSLQQVWTLNLDVRTYSP